MESSPEKSQLDEVKDYAKGTRLLILDLILKFEEIGIKDRHFFTDEELEDEDFEHPAEEFFLGIGNLRTIAAVLEEFEADKLPDSLNYMSSIYERTSWIIQQIFSGLKAMGLTIRTDLYRYNEEVHNIARDFGELDKRLRVLQATVEKWKLDLEQKKQEEKSNETNEEYEIIKQLRLTILKFKWAMIFVIGTTVLSSTCYFNYAAKSLQKLRLENTELKAKFEETKAERDKTRRLFEICAGHTNDDSKYPQIKPQD